MTQTGWGAFATITSGGSSGTHTCGIDPAGAAWCWGKLAAPLAGPDAALKHGCSVRLHEPRVLCGAARGSPLAGTRQTDPADLPGRPLAYSPSRAILTPVPLGAW